jgi:hypothetical protein
MGASGLSEKSGCGAAWLILLEGGAHQYAPAARGGRNSPNETSAHNEGDCIQPAKQSFVSCVPTRNDELRGKNLTLAR